MAPACKLCKRSFELHNCTPVALGCGHCFCRQCLITEEKKSKKLRCSTCMRPHKGVLVGDLPINKDFLDTDSSQRTPVIPRSPTMKIQEDAIFIIVKTSSGMKIHIKTQRNKKVGELKLQLQIKYGIDEQSSFLSTESEQLDDDKYLLDYNITSETIIYAEGKEEEEEVIKPLGEGGFGKVYLIKKNDMRVVLKKVDLSRLNSKARKLSIQEMKLLEDLNHPNIVSYEGGYEKDECLHTLMEYCSGGDLANQMEMKMKEGGFFEERKVLPWIQKIADALTYIHDRKIIHRDIKPANIFLSSSGTIKLGDFGISKVLGEDTHASTMIGTSKYIAIEVVNGGGFTTKADIFALGCCMYELAALKSNYPYMQVVLDKSFSDGYKSLAVNLLDHNPDNRPDANEILRLPIFKHIRERKKSVDPKHFLTKEELDINQESDERKEDIKDDDADASDINSLEGLSLKDSKQYPKAKPRRSLGTVPSTPLQERSKEPSVDSCLLVLENICGELKAGNILDQRKALDDIIFAMNLFQQNVEVLHKGCSALEKICSQSDKKFLTSAVKEEMSVVLLSTLDNHLENETLIMYCCLILHDLGKRHRLVLRLEQLVPIILRIIKPSADEVYKDMSKLALAVISSTLHRVGEDARKSIARMGTIEELLNIIRHAQGEEYDEELLQSCWSIVVSLTEETPANSEIFVSHDGLPLILNCLSRSSTAEEWETSLWIALANISEVKDLRPKLLQPDILFVLLKHLDPSTNQTQRSWEAAQVLVNLLSDGEKAWTLPSPERSVLIQKLAEAIEKWDVDSAPGCIFSTLRPFWLLLAADHTSVCQYWAIWTLAKLTRVQRDRYCPMVEEEEGLQRLQHLVKSPSKGVRLLRGPLKKTASNKLSAAILKLTMQVKNTCEDYKMYTGYGTKNREQVTKLFTTAFNGELAAVEEFIELGINLNAKSFIPGHNGRSAIHLATENGHTDVVCALIDAGASVNIKDSEGSSALHTAVWKGHLDLVKLCLVFGADCNSENKAKGWKVVHFAASGGHAPVLEFLKGKCDLKALTGDKKSILHLAAQHGKEDAVSWILTEGFDVGLKDSNSLSALDYATQRYHKNVVKILNDFLNEN